MGILIVSAIVFVAAYAPLRPLKDLWEQDRLPAWTRVPAGILAWAVVLAALGVCVGIATPFVQLFFTPNMVIAYEIGGIAFLAALVWRLSVVFPELLDFDRMNPFLRERLRFENPRKRRGGVFEQLDRHNIREVYRQTTGSSLPEERGLNGDESGVARKQVHAGFENRTGMAFQRDKVVRKNPKEIQELLARPTLLPHQKDELAALAQGRAVDITDSWKLLALRQPSNDLFPLVQKVVVDPAQRLLTLTIHSPSVETAHLADRVRHYRLKQNTYDFFQAVLAENWTPNYLPFVDRFVAEWYHITDEVFVGITLTPLVRCEITVKELQQLAGKFYVAGELRTTPLSSSG